MKTLDDMKLKIKSFWLGYELNIKSLTLLKQSINIIGNGLLIWIVFNPIYPIISYGLGVVLLTHYLKTFRNIIVKG